MSTAFATEMSSALRGLETHRARISRDVQVPTAQLLNWIAFALRTSSALLDGDAEIRATYVVVDRHLTRC